MNYMNMNTMNQMNIINYNHYNLDNDFWNKNKNVKTVRLSYKGEFIQNVDIYQDDDYNSIRERFKSILFRKGKVIYRKAFQNEIIERKSPYETLEDLLNRGVMETNPRVIISNNTFSRLKNFYDCGYNFSDIADGDVLKVEFEHLLYGAGGISALEFIDIDNLTKTKKLYFSKKAPKWRQVSLGLNLFGKCINNKCEAYDEEVIYTAGINSEFDFSSDRKRIRCPICNKNFVPLTMGFWKCEYQIKGEKLKNGDYQEININGKETRGNDFEYYDPYKNETTSWSWLKIFTCHRQKMKYKNYFF